MLLLNWTNSNIKIDNASIQFPSLTGSLRKRMVWSNIENVVQLCLAG